jgi:hypothetical protein
VIPIVRLLETLLRRVMATSVPINSLIKVLVNCATAVQLEQCIRCRGRSLAQAPLGRRPGLPRERAFIFWLRFFWELHSTGAPAVIAHVKKIAELTGAGRGLSIERIC